MKLFREFLMEDDLENHRLTARFNLGESGGQARTVRDLLTGSLVDVKEACEIFLETKLHDSPNWGRSDLREYIAKLHPGASKDNVLITTGTSEALLLLFKVLKPKSVALPMPAFQLLYEIPEALGAQIIPLPIRWCENGIPWVDENEWLNILQTKQPACVLINNPQNPSGLILTDAFLERIDQICRRQNATIIGDEHYRFLSHDTNILGTSIYKSSEITDNKNQNYAFNLAEYNSFVTGSFIKCTGSPGLRIGWCLGPKHILSIMQNEKNYTTHTVNPLTEWISVEVLKNLYSPLWQEVRGEWLQNKRVLNSFLKESQYFYGIAPQGGLVTCVGVKNIRTTTELQNIHQTFLKHGIFMLPLSEMEFGTQNFQKENIYGDKNLSNLNQGFGFRLGLGLSENELKQALITAENLIKNLTN